MDALSDLIASLFPAPAHSNDDPLDSFWNAVKLVRAADLRSWHRFKRYEDHDGITHLQYRQEARRIENLRREIPRLLRARDRIAELDRGQLEEYATEVVNVPASLLRTWVTIPLPGPQFPGTVYKASSPARIEGDVLVVQRKWRTQEVHVWMSCPSHILHAEEIAETRRWLDARPASEKDKLRDIDTTWSSHPVLFISHRWEAVDHPDPGGAQLEKLAALSGCFLIYDYSSFPQDRSSPGLGLIMRNMTRLIDNVVVLASPDYLSRGWCLYEYVVASMRVKIVCDELNDPDFVSLRRWSSTKGPVSTSLKGHSVESNIQNTINRGVLDAVDRIRPKYSQSDFTVQADRDIVTGLLIEDLMDTLPNRKEYPSAYLGEWVDKKWTREELRAAFTERIDWDGMKGTWDHLDTVSMQPSTLDVPTTIQEAVRRGYSIDRPPRMTEWDGIRRVLGA